MIIPLISYHRVNRTFIFYFNFFMFFFFTQSNINLLFETLKLTENLSHFCYVDTSGLHGKVNPHMDGYINARQPPTGLYQNSLRQ